MIQEISENRKRLFKLLLILDSVALLADMLEVLLLALDVLKDEARLLGLEVNWQKTKIQSTTDPATARSSVHISSKPVDVVESFIYLGSEIHSTGSSEPDCASSDWPGQKLFQRLE